MESLDIAMSKLVLIMILSYDNVRGEKGNIGIGTVVTGDVLTKHLKHMEHKRNS